MNHTSRLEPVPSPKSEDPLIFISVASYRDPQLVPTLLDCLQKAGRPELLRFGICWQRDASDPSPDLWTDPRFRVLDVHWRDSQGACWARAEAMKLWQGEDFYLPGRFPLPLCPGLGPHPPAHDGRDR